MADVTKLPTRFRHKAVVTPAEIYRQSKPTDRMVWAVCPYLRQRRNFECDHCPEQEEDEIHGTVIRGCRMLAEEACRSVLAARDVADTDGEVP